MAKDSLFSQVIDWCLTPKTAAAKPVAWRRAANAG
jgi:hypothetical protein